jgi:hypothetical protein
MIKLLAASAATFLCAGAALAGPIIDGSYDAAYGVAKSTVTLNSALASYDFGAPTQYSNATSYSIFLATDADFVYGYFKADTVGNGSFANIYFDIDPANNNGSDLGFEVTNDRAFVPGMAGYSGPLAGLNFAISGDGTGVEFSIANELFTGPIGGLTYYGGQDFPSVGDDIVLRLSQSFNYTVAGGASYGPDRLGRVTLGAEAGAVPEPATWAMMISGFGMVGGAMRRRAKTSVSYA